MRAIVVLFAVLKHDRSETTLVEVASIKMEGSGLLGGDTILLDEWYLTE
jgi:hypothetical protein